MSEERRVYKRLPASHQVLVEIHGGSGEGMSSLAVDISRGGLRLLLSKDVELAAGVSIWTKPQGQQKPVELKGIVRWVDSAPQEGKYWIGVQLNEHTPDDWYNLFST